MTNATAVRQNYLAILVAAVACFLLEAVWFTVFQQAWLEGVGRTQQMLMSAGVNPAIQYGTAFVAAVVIAAAISRIVQATGEQTAMRGIQTGAILWFGFVIPTWATEYAFEVRGIRILAINAGIWLLSMIVMGAIVGAWKKKAKA